MTALEYHVQRLDPEAQFDFLTWVAEQPPLVRELVEHFPPMMKVKVDGAIWWVIGFEETEGSDHAHVLCSPINPYGDGTYEQALAAAKSLCPRRFHYHYEAELN